MTLTFRDVVNFLVLKKLMDYLSELWLCLSGFFMFKILFEWNIGCSGNKSMTLFSLLEDKVGPGVVNTPQELCQS